MLGAPVREASGPPAGPRIETRPIAPRFASEDDDDENNVTPAAQARPQSPVLVPVSAREFVSAFRIHEPEPATMEVPEQQELSGPDDESELVGAAVAARSVQTEESTPVHPAFVEEPAENLEIPAFMRQGTL